MKDNPIWLVAIFAVLLGLGSRTATATEIDVLVDRYRAPIVMEAVDPATPDALESVVVLDQTVSELLATQITDPDAPGYGGWDPDMNINSQEISYNGQYFRRTQHLAWAWACPASSHYQSSEVATSLNLALEAGLPLLEMHSHPGNWWAWQIGIPRNLGDTMLIGRDAISSSIWDRAITEQVYLTKTGSLGTSGGVNTAWKAMVQFRTGLLTENDSLLDKAAYTIDGLLVRTNDAINPDYSYFYHGDGLNLGYGMQHWDLSARYARVMQGSEWELSAAGGARLDNWTSEFFGWSTWNGMWTSPWCLGRAGSRAFGTGQVRNRMGKPSLEMAHAGTTLENRQAFMAMGQEHYYDMLGPGPDPSSYYLRETAGVQAAEPVYGAHYFPYADYFTSRQPDWSGSVRMSSTRTKTWFSTSSENRKGHETAEGALVLMTEPEDYGYDVLVTMPYDDLPGVTRVAGLKRVHDTKGEATQVGGVTLDGAGLVAMDYKITGATQSLVANKSYLTLPGAIVMMGSGINSTGSGEVTSTLYACPQHEETTWTMDGDALGWSDFATTVSGEHWFHASDVGVVTLGPMDLDVEMQTITATSDRINTVYGTDETYSNRFAIINVHHGENPTDGSYAAVLLPTATPEQTAAFAASPTIRVLANRPSVHAVRTKEGLTAAAFFEADQVEGGVWASGTMQLLVQRDPANATLAVMAPPGSTFGQEAIRKVWLPGYYDAATPPAELLDLHHRSGGTCVTLRLGTGEAFSMSLSKVSAAPEIHEMALDETWEFTENFYNVSSGGGGFTFDGSGMGSDGSPGRLALSSNAGSPSAPDVAVYDWIPDDQPGDVGAIGSFQASLDFKFTDETTSEQYVGLAFHVDDHRGDGMAGDDCLILQLGNLDHAGDPSDRWSLMRGSVELAEYGTVLQQRDLPSGQSISQHADNGGEDWYRLSVTVENSADNTSMDLSASLIDLATLDTVDTWILEDLDFATTLDGAAARGEIGLLASDVAGDSSVLLDQVVVEFLTPPSIPGDANGDGKVDQQDAGTLASHWGWTGATWQMGDFDDNAIIGPGDAAILAAHWAYGTSGEAHRTTIPEPGAIVLLLSAPVLLLAPRRMSTMFNHQARHLPMKDNRIRKAAIGLICLVVPIVSAAAAQNGQSDLPVFKRLGIIVDFKDLKYNPANDVIFPSVIEASRYFKKPLGAYYMYYAPHNAPGGICLAYADALEGPWREYGKNPLIGRQWEPHYRVSHVSSPHALWIEEEKKLFLWFHGENKITRYASSTDGIHFAYEGVAVSVKDFNNICECSYARVFKHSISQLGNRYVILLMGNHKGKRSIYLGWSKDARHWKTRREPFISAPPESSSGQTVSPWLLPWNGKLYVIHHSRFRFDRLGELRSMLATQIDPGFQEKRAAVHLFTAIPGEPDNGRVASPCFIQEGKKLYMFYQSGKRLRSKIALAVADVPPRADTQENVRAD